jgi:E3 ubiquitin-protein ligase TRIP12
VRAQELDLYDIETLDPELGRTLFEMQVLVRRKQFLEASGQAVDGLRFRGSRVEDLCLDFTLPGYPEYELKSKGRDVTVRGTGVSVGVGWCFGGVEGVGGLMRNVWEV